jgi:hypothetical protein
MHVFGVSLTALQLGVLQKFSYYSLDNYIDPCYYLVLPLKRN